MENSEANLTEIWTEFLSQNKYRHAVTEMADLYPFKQSLDVDFSDLENYDIDFTQELLDKPSNCLYLGELAMKDLVPHDQKKKVDEVHLRIRGLPHRIKISGIRKNHIGKLISVSGVVTKSTPVKFQLTLGVFECMRCGTIITQAQERLQFVEPLECYKDQGGCLRTAGSTKFRFLEMTSRYINYQMIELQESTDELKSGIQPQRITAKVFDELAGTIAPGDRIILTSILLTQQKKKKGTGTSGSPVFERYLGVNAIDFEEKAYEDIEITPAEEQRILALKDQGSLFDNLVASIAPSIYGLRDIKEALVLYLFGGSPKILPDETRVRGDIHILLCGDPGTAKSTLLHRIKDISPRSIFSSGKTSSPAGLIAGAVKDEFGEGRWMLEAGALVLAHGGHAIIDELDKMHEKDRDIFSEAMAHQKTTISKVGIQATLKSECGILAAANPKKGRIETDSEDSITKQLNLPAPLLSRFDAIFIVTDEPDKKEDQCKADHILSNLISGQAATHRSKKSSAAGPELAELEAKYDPYFETEFLKKFIAYARRNYFPVMGFESLEMIKDYWVEIRSKSAEGRVSITARQLLGIVRLAEASARSRLSDEILKVDVTRAIAITQYYLKGLSDGSEMDIDIIEGEYTHSQRTKNRLLLEIVRDLTGDESNALIDDIIAVAMNKGLKESQVIAALERLQKDNIIYSIGGDNYRLIRA